MYPASGLYSCTARACRPEDVLLALEAALEVNEHLRKDVELKGNQLQDMRGQMLTLERRLQDLSAKLKAAQRRDDDHVEEHVATVVCHETCN